MQYGFRNVYERNPLFALHLKANNDYTFIKVPFLYM